MWANTVWGFIALAVTFGFAGLNGLAPEWAWLRPWLFLASAISCIGFVVSLCWPLFFAVSKTIRSLNLDDRYLMALEGVVRKNTNFGPFTAGDGDYGHMSWDRARAVIEKLLSLGLVEVSTRAEMNGQFTWTRRGRSVLKRLSERDAQVIS